VDFSGNPDVQIIVTQYVWADGDQLGGMRGLDLLYEHNKPIEFNETNYYPFWYKGDKVGDSRVEAWEFMVGGGASFNQLNGVYTVDDPAGKTPDNLQILTALQNLKNFLESFDFLKMHPDKSFLLGGIPPEALCRGISQPGQQYALYHHHSTGGRGNPNLGGDAYTVAPGEYTENLNLNLPPGKYKADWVDPASGNVLDTETFNHKGGNRTLTTPKHSVDIALRIKRA
jgi:hypothetical protein